MPKKSECKKGRVAKGGAACQTSKDESIPKLTNLSATAFPSQKIYAMKTYVLQLGRTILPTNS